MLSRLTQALSDRYRLDREIGAGGMATVYRAHDLKHDRDVAIKVLHTEPGITFGAERFLSEIRISARLQHPHILPLLDSGTADGLPYYVMPLVTGETLRAKLEREQQLPIDDVLRIARAVADALGYAHEQGIVHRDIKPENILLQGAHALVADFGIALAVQSAGGARMTQTGMSLGTPQYMSPEQALGQRNLDARSDIYSLGALTYEMLAGEAPFTGSSAQAIVARVLGEKPPALHVVRDTVPVHVESAISKALAKLPADRFQTAAEFTQALTIRAETETVHTTRPVAQSHAPARRSLIALGAVCLALAAFEIWHWSKSVADLPTTRAYLRFPTAEAPNAIKSSRAIFPDGQAIVYVGRASDTTQLWIKKRGELHATPISGTVGAVSAFVSGDGLWIGFIAEGKVLKVPVQGGVPVQVGDALCTDAVCDISESGAFLGDGRVVHNYRDGLVISRGDGSPADSLVRSRDIIGFTAIQPQVLPGSKTVLFTRCTVYCNRADIYSVNVDGSNIQLLIPFAANPRYVPTGHLLYSDPSGSVYAVQFDVGTLQVSGKPVKVLDNVIGPLAIAENGTMLYADGDARPRSELMLVERNGAEHPVDTSWRANFTSLALSPDGQRIAASLVHANGEEHIWVKDLNGGPPSRITFASGQHTAPTWSADGKSIMYNRFERFGKAGQAANDSNWLLVRPADGSGQEDVLHHGANWVVESAVSRDGTWRLQREYHPADGSRDIYARQVSGDTTFRAVVATPASDFSPTVSPDNRWIAYASEEGGPLGVWAAPFPNAGGTKWQVAPRGGWEPTWSRDGKELFYVSPADSLVSVGASGTSGLNLGAHRALFSVASYRRFHSHRAYDVRPGNAGFVMIRDGAPLASDLVLVENWFTELRTKMARP